MKRKHSAALILLLVALVAIIGIGFYRSVTHQEARPTDSSTPDGSPPPSGH